MKKGKQFPHKNRTVVAKPESVGKIVYIPTEEEKTEAKRLAKIRRFEDMNRQTIYGPLSVEQVALEFDKLEKKISWKKEMDARRELKKLKAEAKKILKDEERKLKAILADAEREAKKLEAAERKEQRLEAERTFGMGVSPVEAIAIMKEAENYRLLIDTIAADITDAYNARDEYRDEARALKARMDQYAKTLKEPMKSSKYRAMVLEKKTLEFRISLCKKEASALRQKGTAMEGEYKALKRQIKMLKRYGNSATRPTVRAFQNELDRITSQKTLVEGVRQLETIAERVKKDSFQIQSWDANNVLTSSGLKPLFTAANKYWAGMKNGRDAEKAFAESKDAIRELEQLVKNKVPIKLDVRFSRPTRIQQNMLGLCMRIDTEDPATRSEWISVEHQFHTLLNPSWKLFSNDKKEGKKCAQEFVESVHELLDNVEVTLWSGETVTYNGLYASASHQKKEKLICCQKELMELHEPIVWFGRTKAFVMNTALTGAKIWKMRANLARPIAYEIKTKDGLPVYLHNIHMVPDVVKTYFHENALFVGNDHNGEPYEAKAGQNKVILGDGGALAMIELNTNAAQGGGAGVKFMEVNGMEAREYAEKKRGIKGVMPEGKFILCGSGCFKFDDLYDSFDEFAARMDELADLYPGINQVYALRQSEELEDEDKIRKISRSLTQQLYIAAEEDNEKLAKATVDSLLYKKTFEGLFASLAELGVTVTKRSPFARLVLECPELLTNINVQMIGQKSWEAKQADAIGNKLQTKGQYPYIMQDPVALIEVWLLGVNPDDPDLGVLKAGEVSVVGVPDNKEMVAIRYPANFLTVKTVVNKVMLDVFGRCGNVAILSVHDDILIIQDGDVDGDEMGFFYDKLLVKLVNKMRSELNPPVVVFEHGDKAPKVTIADEAAKTGRSKEDVLRHRMFAALSSAKEHDSVGKYANLARDCAYLMSIAYRNSKDCRANGDIAGVMHWEALHRQYFLWMALASTGAILAIDQVKGNAIDPKLIEKLETISEEVRKILVRPVEITRNGKTFTIQKYAAPFTQSYVKGDKSIETLEANPQVSTDNMGMYVLQTTGGWSLNMQEFVSNNDLLATVLLDHRSQAKSVQSGVVQSGILTELRANYFNRKFVGKDGKEKNPDGKIMNLIANKLPVGQKDLLLLYWRNMHTLEFRMQEKTTTGKRAAYYEMVRRTVIEHALSHPWYATEFTEGFEAGYEFTDEERIRTVINAAVKDALELGKRGNGLPNEDKASYAKFILNVFANDLIENVRRNSVDIRKFMMEGVEVKSFIEDTDYEASNFNLLIEAEENDYGITMCDDNAVRYEEPPRLSDDELEEEFNNLPDDYDL